MTTYSPLDNIRAESLLIAASALIATVTGKAARGPWTSLERRQVYVETLARMDFGRLRALIAMDRDLKALRQFDHLLVRDVGLRRAQLQGLMNGDNR